MKYLLRAFFKAYFVMTVILLVLLLTFVTIFQIPYEKIDKTGLALGYTILGFLLTLIFWASGD